MIHGMDTGILNFEYILLVRSQLGLASIDTTERYKYTNIYYLCHRIIN